MTQHNDPLLTLPIESEPGTLDVEAAAAAIAECKDFDELRDVRDKAKAIEAYQRTRKASLDAQNDAAEIVLRAERRLGQLCKETTGGKAGGRNAKAKSHDVILLSDLGITAAQSSRWQKLAKIPKPVFEQHIDSVRARCEKLTTSGTVAAVSFGQAYDGDEWYTPPEHIEAAREVLGGIDLDPASNEIAQRTVSASTFFTKGDDGLCKPWKGRVFLNPPYSAELAGAFAQKLIAEIKAQRVTAAILLQNCTVTDRAWFHDLVSLGCALCFTRGRLKFIQPDGSRGEANRYGQVFVYFGPRPERFAATFGSIGLVVAPLRGKR